MSKRHDDDRYAFEIDGEVYTVHPELVRLAEMGAFDEELFPPGDFEFESSGTFRRFWPKVGRNEPCPCGSGKKYKRCCGRGE